MNQMPLPEPVSREQAFADLLSWWDTGTQRVAELVGPAGSGRTEVLLRIREAVPGSLLVDAAGLTAEELVVQVMAAAGVGMPAERRADWGLALEESSASGGLLIVSNAQRAGRTRRSAQVERIVKHLASDIAVRGGMKVLIERDPDDVEWTYNSITVLEHATPQVVDTTDIALHSLALAETRRTPVAVWSELHRILASLQGRTAGPASLLETSGDAVVVDDGMVSFRDERVAEAFRRSTEAETLRVVSSRLVEWLRNWLTDRVGRATDTVESVAKFVAHGLAMHAVQAGVFSEIQRDGALAAHLDQMALIDAAMCTDSNHWIDENCPAGDAANLWMCGVDSLPQGEWASWLHLVCTARGDMETADAIERSGQEMPWRVRWTHWRPPGGTRASFVRPGPLESLRLAPGDAWQCENVVIAQGLWDRRYRVWDAETGRPVAGPWPSEVPADGEREPLWLPDQERGVTPSWTEMAEYNDVEPPFISGQITVGEDVVVAGLGGLFAVRPSAPSTFEGLSKVHGEPMFLDTSPVCAVESLRRVTPDPFDPELFEPGVVRRLPAEQLPDGMEDADARRVLTEVGLPAFDGAEFRLVALDEQGLPEVAHDLPAEALPGAYYEIGMWMGGHLCLHGDTGRVFWLSEDYEFPAAEYDEDDYEDEAEVEPGLVASSLTTFIDLLQVYLVSRCMLASAASRLEREAVREYLEIALSGIDEAGAAGGLWTSSLHDFD
ncbi:SUKH-4 family immunity protein [Streptomyces sp. NBC_01614]|uniref:SUKH-4 family immunity protein n=1 Tax=Streptomyces sp. NBC_01614 TaxID=2975897 RepID=UPI00386ECFC7